jgi:tetratricopeptide (TPR) repeat protein
VVPAVAPLELDLLAGLASLVDRNLVRDTTDFDRSSRFAMLETIREFALEVLAASGELPATQLALARWNLVLIDVENLQLSPGLQALAQRRLASDFDNLRASLRWAIDQEDSALANRLSGGLGVFWYSHGDLVEGRRWLEATLAMTGPIPAEVQALALLSAGRLAHYQGNASRAEELLRKSLSLYKRLGDCDGRGKALMLLGITEEDAGEYLAAKHLLDEARHCFDEIGDRGQAALVIYHLGVTAYGIGELDQAMACYAEALRISREVGDSFVIAATQEFITLACCARGDFRQAAEACEEALAIDWDRGSLEGADQEGIAINFANLSVLAVAIELDAIAVRIRAAAESIRDRIGLSSIRLPERLDYEHAMETALQRLGEREFATCWSTGLTEPWDNRQQDIDTALSHARIIGSRR